MTDEHARKLLAHVQLNTAQIADAPDALVVNVSSRLNRRSFLAYRTPRAAEIGIDEFGDSGDPVFYLHGRVVDRLRQAALDAERVGELRATAAEVRHGRKDLVREAEDAQYAARSAFYDVQRCIRDITEARLEADRESASDNIVRVQHAARSRYAYARKLASRVADVDRWLALPLAPPPFPGAAQ